MASYETATGLGDISEGSTAAESTGRADFSDMAATDYGAGNRAVDAERRAAIKKLGRFAAYTAPAVLVTMTAAKAQAASICTRDPNYCAPQG